MFKLFITQRFSDILFACFIVLFFCTQACTIKKNPSHTASIPLSPAKCVCSDAGSPSDTTFLFSNKKIISLCGNKTYTAKGAVFNKLAVAECNKSMAIVFDASTSFLPLFKNDTLFLQELYSLPIGDKLDYKDVCVLQHKVWFKQDSMKSRLLINNDFPAYSSSQVLDVFEQYQMIEVEYNEKTILLMDKLFVASLSGNILAVKTFKNFEAKYKNLDGIYKDRYNKLTKLLLLYFEIK